MGFSQDLLTQESLQLALLQQETDCPEPPGCRTLLVRSPWCSLVAGLGPGISLEHWKTKLMGNSKAMTSSSA